MLEPTDAVNCPEVTRQNRASSLPRAAINQPDVPEGAKLRPSIEARGLDVLPEGRNVTLLPEGSGGVTTTATCRLTTPPRPSAAVTVTECSPAWPKVHEAVLPVRVVPSGIRQVIVTGSPSGSDADAV
jgi:hypothetical protein